MGKEDEELRIVVKTKEAIKKLGAFGKKASETFKKSGRGARKAGESFKAVGLAAKAFLASAAVQAIKRVGMAMFELVKGASELQQVENSFRSVAKAANASADESLKAWTKASGGMVSSAALMKNANQAALLGIDIFKKNTKTQSTRFQEMIEIARAASTATGQSMEFMLNSITTGMGRASPLILDNLGIVVKSGEAYDAYAASIGKTAKQLTDAEKKIAFQEAAMKAGRAMVQQFSADMKELGLEGYKPFTDRVAEAGATFENFQNKLGKFAIPAVQTVMDTLDETISDVSKTLGLSKTDWGEWRVWITFILKNLIVVIGAWAKLFITQVRTVASILSNLIDSLSASWRALRAIARGDGAAFSKAMGEISDSFIDSGKLMVKAIKEIPKAFKALRTGVKSIGEVRAELKKATDDAKKFNEAMAARKGTIGAGPAEEAAVDIKEEKKKKKKKDPILELENRLARESEIIEELDLAWSAYFEKRGETENLDRENTILAMEEKFGKEKTLTLLLAQENQKRVLNSTASEQAKARALSILDNIDKKFAKAREERDKKSTQRRIGLARSAAGQLGGIAGNLASLQDRTTRSGARNYKRLKKLQIVADTASAMMSAYSSQVGIPIVGPVLAGAAMATAALMGAQSMRALESQSAAVNIESVLRGAFESRQAAAVQQFESRIIDQFNASTGGTIPQAEHGGIIPGSRSGMLIQAGERNKTEAIIPLEDDSSPLLGGVTINIDTFTGTDENYQRLADELDAIFFDRLRAGKFLTGSELNDQARETAEAL